MKRFFTLLTGWLLWFSPQAQKVYTMQYWFDGQYDSRQAVTSNTAIWQSQLDVGNLAEGMHTLSFHIQDTSGRWTSPRMFVFYRSISFDTTEYGYTMDYTCWYDHDYSSHFSGTIAGGGLLLDVSQLSNGMHTISIQLGSGRTAQMQENVFYRPTHYDSISYNYTMDYTYWYDHDYSSRFSGTIAGGGLLLDVSQLSDGIHTISIQMGGGRTAQLQEYVFYRPAHYDSISYNYTMDYTCWYDHDYSSRFGGTIVGGGLLLDVSQLSDGIHTISIQMGGGRTAQLQEYVFYRPFHFDSVESTFEQTYTYWFDHEYTSRQTGNIVGGGMLVDVSQLRDGLHTFCIQLGEGRMSQLQQYVFYKPIMFDSLDNSFAQTYTYWFDHQYSERQSGAFTDGNILVDVNHLSEGIHTFSLQLGEDNKAQLQNYVFLKPFNNNFDSLEHIARYEYVLNGDESDRHITPVLPCDTLQLITLLPLDTLPIRSTCFEFDPNGGVPVIYAKNDIRLRFWTEGKRFAEYSTKYVDENVVDTIYADTIERGATKTIAAPSNDNIHWFKLAAGTGDSLSFSANRRCTMQLFAPSGELVFQSSGDSVLTWIGCHAWENGVYYLAVHDAEGVGNMTVSYQWVYRYAVLAWDVHRVGNGGISTITFEGNGFNSLDTLFLIKGNDTIPTLYIDRESRSLMRSIFNFENADTGVYNATFVFVDETLYMTNVVDVDTAIPIVLTSTVSYPETFLRGSTVTYTFEITNTGNMTAYNVPLYTYIGSSTLDGVSHIKYDGLNLPSIIEGLDLDSLSTDEIAELQEWAEDFGDDHYFFKFRSYDTISGDSIWVRSNYFFLTLEPYESRMLSLKLTTTGSVDVWFTLPDTIAPLVLLPIDTTPQPLLLMAKSSSWGGYARDGYCCVKDHITCVLNLASEGLDIAELIADAAPGTPPALVINAASCIVGLAQNFNTAMSKWLCQEESQNGWMDFFNNAMDWESIASTSIKCVQRFIPGLSGKKIIEIAQKITDMIDNTLKYSGYSHASTVVDCITSFTKKQPNCPPDPPKGGESQPQQPVDPNEITGFIAESGSYAIGKEQLQLPYMIEFENDTAFATAHAHTIIVRDTLDGNVCNLNSFSATSFAIGDDVLTVSGGQQFTYTVDMRPDINVVTQVQLDYRIDTTFAVATWTFSSLDPMTLQPAADTLGFLGIGNTGEVNFTINRKANLPDSTIIDNRAWITFDNEEPISTSTWRNIIDATQPESSIDSIVYDGDTTVVSVTASDNLSGVWKYNVYARLGGNTVQPMALNIPVDSVARFIPPTGVVQYHSAAIDSAGNIEAIFTVRDTINAIACDTYTLGNNTYSTGGEYVWTRSSSSTEGFDSVTVLYLTINHSTTRDTSATVCDSFTWHGVTYTESESPSYQITNAVGCDSTITLHLTVNHISTSDTMATVCDSLLWHGEMYRENTLASYSLIGVNGCDSIVTLHLTVNYSTVTSDSIELTAEELPYNYNGLTIDSAGVYTTSLETTAGCDSIVLLYVTVTQNGIIHPDGYGNAQVHPNPTTGVLTIVDEMALLVEVYDGTGRKVHECQNTNTIDISSLPSGSYTLRITLQNGIAIQKVIKL